MTDREAVARELARRTLERILRSGDVAEHGSPAELALAAVRSEDKLWRDYLPDADAAIACLRERWTSDEVAALVAKLPEVG